MSEAVASRLDDIRRLAGLADSIRTHEGTDDGDALGAATRTAREESAALLRRIAAHVPEPESEVIAMRAAGLNGGDSAAAAVRQAEITEQDLVLLCGPMSTWRRKSGETFYSTLASVPLASWNAVLARADSLHDELRAFLADLLVQPGLRVRPIPGFVITDLVDCGGEANGFPKHFAYFLPEDEGVSGASTAKTVVYANVYAAHHELVSEQLADLILEPAESASPDETLELLLLWFRGHDLGHQLRLPGTSFRDLHAVGRETSIALQEALADVIGYLVVTGGPWHAEFGYERAAAGSVFLAEMLRYIQRGPGLFPDSDAAFLELSYLVAGGYVETRGGARLAWDPDTLHDGLVALARELTEGILGTNVERAEALIEAHLPLDHEPLADWRADFDAVTSNVPTTLAYDVAGAHGALSAALIKESAT
ncbi:MAG: hypothetical protein M3540_11380 [Actinomycetota bacterium]|nr:hypothetical protein [Actinomycetota bacterium]